MLRLWSEWAVPSAYHRYIDAPYSLAGPATDTPDAPYIALPGAHAILAAHLPFDGEVMDLSPDLLVVSRCGAGYDNVDVAAATERGIAVTNAPDGPTLSTAEHAMALIFAAGKQLQSAGRALEQENIRPDHYMHHTGIELLNSTLGLVGFGRIGQRVAQLARGVGMQVLAYSRSLTDNEAVTHGVMRASSLEELLGRADVVSLHVPLTPATHKLINRETLAMMKPGAFLINTTRGGTVDEAALLEALESGHLGGAGLDVFDPEPPDPANPLLHRDDVVVTAHVGSSTAQGRARIWETALRQAVDVCAGRRPVNLLNPGVWPRVSERRAAILGE